jgi:aminoglycoside 2'-N-acetyltransferase I
MSPAGDVVVTTRISADLDAAERAAVIEVCNAANDTDAFRELFDLVPPDGRHVLVHRGGDLVSHAVASTRGVQPAGLPVLRTAFLDAVATRPEEQHRGHGSAALRRMAAVIADFDVGCLQTDVRGFYEPLGWEPWLGPLAGRGDDGLIPTPSQTGVMILRLPNTPVLDLHALLSIECQPRRIWE